MVWGGMRVHHHNASLNTYQCCYAYLKKRIRVKDWSERYTREATADVQPTDDRQPASDRQNLTTGN